MRKWRLWIGIAISLVCLALALAGIEWDQVGVALRRADWRYLIPAAASLLAYLLARSVRWRILLGPEVSLAEAFAVTNVGYLVSNVLPFRLGDPARAVAIGLGGKVRTSAALSTVVVERVLDMLMVVLLLALTVPFVGEAGWMREAGMLGGAAALAALAVLVVLAQRPEWGQRVLQWGLARVRGVLPSPSVGGGVGGGGRTGRACPEPATSVVEGRSRGERWARTLGGLLDGLAALRSARRTAGLLVWSVVVWVFVVGYYFAMLWAFLDRPSLVEGSFLTCAIGLGMALPAAPGAVGVFHSVARYALQLPFGVLEEEAVLVAFASHAFQYVLVCLLGLVGLAQQNLSFGRLRSDVATTLEEE